MDFIAKAKFLKFSPHKLRLVVDVVRGKKVDYALNWLASYRVCRAEPIRKVIESAVANAKNNANVDLKTLFIKEIKVDGGPVFRYFKPGAMGRANPQKKRLSHISVTLESRQV